MQVLLYISRTLHLAQPYQYDQIMKKSEQMYKLIAMCIAICPQRQVEDSIMQHLTVCVRAFMRVPARKQG